MARLHFAQHAERGEVRAMWLTSKVSTNMVSDWQSNGNVPGLGRHFGRLDVWVMNNTGSISSVFSDLFDHPSFSDDELARVPDWRRSGMLILPTTKRKPVPTHRTRPKHSSHKLSLARMGIGYENMPVLQYFTYACLAFWTIPEEAFSLVLGDKLDLWPTRQ